MILANVLLSIAVAASYMEVSEKNVDKVAKAISSGQLDPGAIYTLGGGASPKMSPKVMKRLSQIPTDNLVTAMEQAADAQNRGFIAKIIAYKGEGPAFAKVARAAARGDIALQDFKTVAMLDKHLSLPDDFRPIIEDTSVLCGTREAFVEMLAIAPSAASVTLVEDLYKTPEKQNCGVAGLRRDRLLKALGALALDDAIPFFRALPRCVEGAQSDPLHRRVQNPDRNIVIDMLQNWPGEQAVDALLGFANDQLTDDEMKSCDTHRVGERLGEPTRPFPWRDRALRVLSQRATAKGSDVKLEQLAQAAAIDPTNGDILYALLAHGKPARSQLEQLLAQPKCGAVMSLAGIGKNGQQLVDRSFLAGSKVSEVLISLLTGLSERQTETEQPKSEAWDAIRADNAKCLSYSGDLSGIIRFVGEIGDPKASDVLLKLYANAPLVYGQQKTFYAQRDVIQALGGVRTKEAHQKLGEIVSSEQSQELRAAARTALAESQKRH